MPIEAVVARTVQILLALAGAYLVALWFVLAVWAYRDIESRSRNVLTQIFSTLLVVLFWVPGVLLYLILRPKETLDGAYQRSLEEEYLLQDLEELPLCPSCERYVEDDFILCPHSHTRLREPCLACDRLIDLRWSVCAYCGAAQGGETAGKPERVEEPAARWRSPVQLRRAAASEVAEASSAGELKELAAAEIQVQDEEVIAMSAPEAPPADPPPVVEPPEAGSDAAAVETNGASEVRAPIPLVPVPRGRFGRAGAVERRQSPKTGEREPAESRELVSASGPFTSILGTRSQENGRIGPAGARARRAARLLERLPDANGSAQTDLSGESSGRRLSRLVPPGESVASQPTESEESESDSASVSADGKGD